MIITDEYTKEFVHNNIKLIETRNIVENTLLEYERKYGANCCRSVKVECVAKFLDKIKNETKFITIELYNIIGGVNKVMQSSKGRGKLITLNELKIIIQGRVYRTDVNAKLNCKKVRILWKEYFVKIANDRDCVANKFIQHCRERHVCNSNGCKSIK